MRKMALSLSLLGMMSAVMNTLTSLAGMSFAMPLRASESKNAPIPSNSNSGSLILLLVITLWPAMLLLLLSMMFTQKAKTAN